MPSPASAIPKTARMSEWKRQNKHAGAVIIETHPQDGVRALCGDCGWRTASPFDLYAVRGDALLHAMSKCPGPKAQKEMLL